MDVFRHGKVFRAEEFVFTGVLVTQQAFFSLILPSSEKKRKAGEGMTVSTCYALSGNRNGLFQIFNVPQYLK